MTYDEWYQLGVQNKWCSEVACSTHDGIPMTPEEEAEWDEGYDPCVPVLRLWDV
jgi:hypothetical protein